MKGKCVVCKSKGGSGTAKLCYDSAVRVAVAASSAARRAEIELWLVVVCCRMASERVCPFVHQSLSAMAREKDRFLRRG